MVDRVERGCWLAPDVLLLVVGARLDSRAHHGRLHVDCDGRRATLGARWLQCTAEIDGQARPSLLITARSPALLSGASLSRFELETGEERRPLVPESVD